MDEQENARHGGRAKNTSGSESRTTQGERQARRLPTPTQIKQAVDPADFYRREFPNAPEFKFKANGWTHNFVCPSPTHEDKEGSFGFNRKSGACRCHGCGLQCGSVIDTLQWRDGLSLDEARARFADDYGVAAGTGPATTRPPSPKPAALAPKTPPAPAAPIPPEALATRPKTCGNLGAPSCIWPYVDAAGRPVAFVARFEITAKDGSPDKTFRPLSWTEARGWTWTDPPGVWPLYSLDLLTKRPASLVLIAEGEKSADAAALLLPDMVATTTAHGAQSPQKTDFGPLAGRHVRIWPDNDAAGAAYAVKVAALARAAGAASVEVLDLSALAVSL